MSVTESYVPWDPDALVEAALESRASVEGMAPRPRKEIPIRVPSAEEIEKGLREWGVQTRRI